MHTKLPLLSLLFAFGLNAGAQTEPKKVPLKSEYVPYTWMMMPTTEFFKLTGLSATDSVTQNAYVVGDRQQAHVVVFTNRIEELGIDVVSWVEYINFKNKAMESITAALQEDYAVERMSSDDSVWYQYFTPEAYVEVTLNASGKKTSNLLLSGYDLYRFMPPLEQVVAKLDSTKEQLLANVRHGERSIRHDSDGYMVYIRNVTPLVSYGIMYESSGRPKAYVFLNDDGGQAVLRWAVKSYYDMFFDEYNGSTYWVKDINKDWVGLGILLSDGAIVHEYITQEKYQEWAYDEGEYEEE